MIASINKRFNFVRCQCYFPLPFDPLFFPIFGVGDFVIENEDIFL